MTITYTLKTHFGALADFEIILQKARMRTVRELTRKTPGSLGAKLLTASTALRAYRNRHLGERHSCDAVKRGNPWGDASIRTPSNASTFTG